MIKLLFNAIAYIFGGHDVSKFRESDEGVLHHDSSSCQGNASARTHHEAKARRKIADDTSRN
jgi:hypothetical protein